ncbi:hypothetical protein BDZ97DRAFT_1920958 [Flammula alnicola]|nr:hypothetical protein BDZ97DRAFT_1920958 [Flammula alnicola]
MLNDTSHTIGRGACFLCDDSAELADSVSHRRKCSPTIDLDLSQGQRVLEHIDAHILFDSMVSQSWSVCGLCLRPSPLCQFFLKKGKGALASVKIDNRLSKGCLMKVKYSYRVAAESSPSSSCSNVPIQAHFRDKHGVQLASKNLWTLSNFELDQMQKIWIKRRHKTVKRTKKPLPLVISEDHRAQIPGSSIVAPTVPEMPDSDSDSDERTSGSASSNSEHLKKNMSESPTSSSRRKLLQWARNGDLPSSNDKESSDIEEDGGLDPQSLCCLVLFGSLPNRSLWYSLFPFLFNASSCNSHLKV